MSKRKTVLIQHRSPICDKYLITRFGSCFNQAGCLWKTRNRAILSTGVDYRGTPGIEILPQPD